MNRAFKLQFHNGTKDERPIVTVSVTVNNGKRFRALDKRGRDKLVSNLEFFKRSLEQFIQEIRDDFYFTPKTK